MRCRPRNSSIRAQASCDAIRLRARAHHEAGHRREVPRGVRASSLRKAWPASGYSLTSCTTPRSVSAAAQRSTLRHAGTGPGRRSSRRPGRRRRGPPRSPRQRAVVGGHGIPPGPAGEHQREPAAHAEPDDADGPGARRVGEQRGPRGLEVVERLSRPACAATSWSGPGTRAAGRARAGRARARGTPSRRAGRRAAASASSRPKISCTSTSPGHGPSPVRHRPVGREVADRRHLTHGATLRRRRPARRRTVSARAGASSSAPGRVGSSSTGSTCSGTLTGRR